MQIKDLEVCNKLLNFQNYINTDDDDLLLSHTMQKLVEQMIANNGRASAISAFRDYLEEHKGEREDAAVSVNILNENDTLRAERFLNAYEKYEFISGSIDCNAELDLKVYHQQVLALCIAPDESIHAIVMRYGSCKRSIKGRAIDTLTTYDDRAIVAKMGLEDTFPNVIIDSYYFKNSNDSVFEVFTEPIISTTKNTNLYRNDFYHFYENGVFSWDKAKESLRSCVSFYGNVKHDCNLCQYVGLCKAPKVEIKPSIKNEKKPYTLPNFTEEQLECVQFTNGTMRVCACAGSGKSSTLVGRARFLKEHGILLPQLLMLSFSNKSVADLIERCESFEKRGDGPKIATVNGMCYEILKQAEDIVGPVELMTEMDSFNLVRAALVYFEDEPIRGFSYGKKLEGSRGLLKEIVNYIDYFRKNGEEAFYEKYSNVERRFTSFYECYKGMMAAQNYITYDEQISLCNKLLEEHPEVLSVYQSIYKYVMVDEYQDIDPEQEKFINFMSQRSGNLVVVGDDDQSIYGFRGASNKYFLDFVNRHPGCREVVFSQNFRTTAAMVESSNMLISKNRNRVDKAVVSMGEDGFEPYIVEGITPEKVQKCIDTALKQGYGFDDITIISSQNSTLENLYKELKCPTYLAKSYLRNDGMFHLCRSIMNLSVNKDDDEALYIFINILNPEIREILGLSTKNEPLMDKLLRISRQDLDNLDENKMLYKELSLLNIYLKLYETSKNAKEFVSGMANFIGYDQSDFVSVVCDLIEQQNMKKEDLRHFFNGCVKNGCDLRVTASSLGRVGLMTMHDSKGTEYPVTIVINDFGKGELTEERRRLMYVAITRAKELEFILQDASANLDFVSEIPGKLLRVG